MCFFIFFLEGIWARKLLTTQNYKITPKFNTDPDRETFQNLMRIIYYLSNLPKVSKPTVSSLYDMIRYHFSFEILSSQESIKV